MSTLLRFEFFNRMSLQSGVYTIANAKHCLFASLPNNNGEQAVVGIGPDGPTAFTDAEKVRLTRVNIATDLTRSIVGNYQHWIRWSIPYTEYQVQV